MAVGKRQTKSFTVDIRSLTWTSSTVKTNQYRNYEESIVSKIALIKDAKQVGFTLAEVKFLPDSWADDKLNTADKAAISLPRSTRLTAKLIIYDR
ncbi:MAG: hypothetical protein V4580_19050 [Bacteroidota bacterium]